MSFALEPGIALETAVLRRRLPKTLLEDPPKGITFHIQYRRRKLTKCFYNSHLSVAFAAGLPGLHRTLAQPKLRPPNLGT